MLTIINTKRYKKIYKTYFESILDNIKKALESKPESKPELESDYSDLAGIRDYMQKIVEETIDSINQVYILEDGRMDLEKAMIHLFNQSDNKDKIIDIANIYLCVTFLYNMKHLNMNNLNLNPEELMMALSNQINIIKHEAVQNVIVYLATMLDNRYSLANTELKDYQEARYIENIIKIKNCFAKLIMLKPYDAKGDIKTISLFIFENILYTEIIKKINNKDNDFSDLHKQCIIDSIKDNKMNDLIEMFKIEDNMSNKKYAYYANILVNLFYHNINEYLLKKDSAIKPDIEPDSQTGDEPGEQRKDLDGGLPHNINPIGTLNPVEKPDPQTSSKKNEKYEGKLDEERLNRKINEIVKNYTSQHCKDITTYKLLKDIKEYSIIVPKDLANNIETKLLHELSEDWGTMFSSKDSKVRIDSATNTIYFKFDKQNFLCGKIIGNLLVFDSDLLQQKEPDHSDATKKSFRARANNAGKKIEKFIESYGMEKFLEELSRNKKQDTGSQFMNKF